MWILYYSLNKINLWIKCAIDLVIFFGNALVCFRFSTHLVGPHNGCEFTYIFYFCLFVCSKRKVTFYFLNISIAHLNPSSFGWRFILKCAVFNNSKKKKKKKVKIINSKKETNSNGIQNYIFGSFSKKSNIAHAWWLHGTGMRVSYVVQMIIFKKKKKITFSLKIQ